MSVGDLVVLPAEPTLGVGRIERFTDLDGAKAVRVLLYPSGEFVVRPLGDVAPCPPGVWPPAG